MSTRKKNPFVARLKEVIAAAAEELQRQIFGTLEADGYLSEAEKFACVKDMLEDELFHFYFRTLKFQLSDSDGLKPILRGIARRSARSGSAKRFDASWKAKFLEWAVEEKVKTPQITKNALAARYAKSNPGTSAATLRRYLAEGELRKMWGDD